MRGLDYSRGMVRLLPGVSKLGRTPSRGQGQQGQAPQGQAPQGRLFWDILFPENCPYEEHCYHSHEFGGTICDCCECCDDCHQPTCWVC